MVLREKLKSIKMTKSETVTCYLSRIAQVRDELGAVGEVIPVAELVRTTLNGVARPWVVFVEAIVARENVPSWDRLWDDFVQEETCRGYVQGGGSSRVQEDEENVALVARGKNKKFKKEGNSGGNKDKGENKEGGEGSEQSLLSGLPEAGALCSYLFREEEGEEEEFVSFDSSG